MKYEFVKTYPATRKTGFEFFMDLARWSEWTPFEVEAPEKAKFAKKGDEIAVTYRRFGIPLHGTVTLDRVGAGELIEATLRFPGAMDIHERFELHGSGTRAFVLTASLEMEQAEHWYGKGLQWMSMTPLMMRWELRRSLDLAHDLLVAPIEAATKAA